jgi:hypothetical protein
MGDQPPAPSAGQDEHKERTVYNIRRHCHESHSPIIYLSLPVSQAVKRLGCSNGVAYVSKYKHPFLSLGRRYGM